MALPTNKKKADSLMNKSQKNQPVGGSKFIKSTSKPAGGGQKKRSTGANRGS